MEFHIVFKLISKIKYPTFLISILLLTLINPGYSSDRYFLCGPDEDGCFPDIYQYCACIPYNELEANSPYCLDFSMMTCIPLSKSPYCSPSFIFKNQGECLATIYQSEPLPPCKITTRAFCLENKTSICDPDGQPQSCH